METTETTFVQHTYVHATHAKPPQNTAPRQSSKPNRRRFKGHSWSKKGSKAQRAAARKQRKMQWFYAVAVGHRFVALCSFGKLCVLCVGVCFFSCLCFIFYLVKNVCALRAYFCFGVFRVFVLVVVLRRHCWT